MYGVDTVRARNCLPAAFGTFEAITISGVVSEVGVDVGNRHQTDRWRISAEDRLGRTVGVCMGASGHAAADDGNPNRVGDDDQLLRSSKPVSVWLPYSQLTRLSAAQELAMPARRAASSRTPEAISRPSMRPSETSSCSMLTSMSGSTMYRAASQVDQ
jgi:hypothetical protein